MTPRRSTRLSRQDWLSTGLDVLRKKGGTAMQAEPMARQLKTTKGSFYWHFKDVADFQSALLDLWETAAIEMIQTCVAQENGEVAALRALAQAFATPASAKSVEITAEPAIRAWATSHATAAAAVQQVDAARTAALATLLSRIGIDNPEMARLIYATAVGMAVTTTATDAENQEAAGSLVDLVLALR